MEVGDLTSTAPQTRRPDTNLRSGDRLNSLSER
jgi:hypothetical protein